MAAGDKKAGWADDKSKEAAAPPTVEDRLAALEARLDSHEARVDKVVDFIGPHGFTE